jgi:hypothetical protein
MKRHTLIVGVACLLVIVGIVRIRAQRGPENNFASENIKIQIGFRIAPVPLNLEGKNSALVGLGSYIVNAQGDCNGCHGNPTYEAGGDPHLGEPEKVSQAGYLLGGSDLFGPFVPRNLTPNSQGRPAGLTLGQFLQVMNEGTDLKHRPPFVPSEANDLLQIMPWPVFSKMTEPDKIAIYEYLRAIPCLGSATRCGT